MSAVCRLTTVAALLLHLIFGCSLHHAAACGSHGHGGCDHARVSTDLPSVQSDHCCGQDHDCSGEDQTVEADDNVSQLVAPCYACQSQPCDGNHPGCHGEVECSFVPSSDVVFIIDAPVGCVCVLRARSDDEFRQFARGPSVATAIGKCRDGLALPLCFSLHVDHLSWGSRE